MTSWTTISQPSAAVWTNVPKPSATTSVITVAVSGGEPLGLLLAITTSSTVGSGSVITSLWTSVAGFATPWTNVPKAT